MRVFDACMEGIWECREGFLGKRNTEQDLANDSADISC